MKHHFFALFAGLGAELVVDGQAKLRHRHLAGQILQLRIAGQIAHQNDLD